MSTGTAGATTPAAGTANSNDGAANTPAGSTGTDSGNGNANSNSNNTRRGCGRFQGRNNNGAGTGTSNFKGTIPTIHTLATKAENGGIDFASFIKSLHQHVVRITALSNPKDIAVAITDFADPLIHMAPTLPTRSSIRRKQSLYPEQPNENKTPEETAAGEEHNKEQTDTVKELQGTEIRIYTDRQKVVTNNLTALWGIIIGQCARPYKKNSGQKKRTT